MKADQQKDSTEHTPTEHIPEENEHTPESTPENNSHTVKGHSASGYTLFEKIMKSDLPDSQTLIVSRTDLVCTLLNRYPYSVGHLLVVPCRVVVELDELTNAESVALWEGVRTAAATVKNVFKPDGLNIGANIGSGAGASVADHMHVHVVPRWNADTGFMSSISNARVLPMTLHECWERLRKVWPHPIGHTLKA